MATFEKATVGEKISNYVENRQNVLIAILAVVVAAVIAYTVAVTVTSKANTKGLAAIDTISYVMTQESASLSEEELEMRRNKAVEDLSAYLEKGGIVGVRANMLAGEIYYSVKDFKNSAKCWTSAAAKGKKSYTAPLAYFNAAVSYENINDLDNAEKYYKYAVFAKDFLMASHAEFSLGRVREAKGDTDGAIEAYRSLLGKNPDTSWGNLAKTRLIALGAE